MTIIQHRDCGDEQEGDMSDEQAAENMKQWEYRWTFLGRRYRAVETEPGIVSYFATREDSDDAPYSWIERPLGLTNELVHLSVERDALRAKNERLLREQAEFTGAALCALGLNRDECVSPGNQVLDEINRLTTKVSELTRLLGEAEERATILAQTILALMQKYPVYLKGKAVGMSDGEAFANAISDALQRAMKGASR